MGNAENMGMRMDNKRAKSSRSASSVAVFMVCLLVICRIATSVEPEVPDEKQLVAFYQATAQKSLFQRDRWIVEANSQTTIEGLLLKTSPRKYVEKYTVYRDRGRLDSRKEQIRMNFPEEEDRIDKKRRQYVILDGRVYSYIRWVDEGQQPRSIIASNDLTKRVIYSAGSDALALAGYISVNEKPLAEILAEESSVLHVQPSMQIVNGFPTYVLEATTPYGHYTVWMDPNCGYSPRRVIVERGPEDILDGKPVSALPSGPSRPPYERVRSVLDILKIKEIGGSFMATEGTTTWTLVYSDGSIKRTHSACELTLVDLHPDFNDIPDAFVLDVPDGTRVHDDDFPAAKFMWQNGKKFVVDEWDGSIRYVPKEWSILVDVGKQLPKFEGIKINLSAKQTKDRAILLCFFDMEQRPSRHYIRQLATQANQLKQKGVTVVAIQVSNVDEDKLNEWVKKYKIPFPVGIVQSDEEKTRFAWGVRSLPWLILTDKEQIVLAEGFSIEELDEELKKTIYAKHTIHKSIATSSKPATQTYEPNHTKPFLDAVEILKAWEINYAHLKSMQVSYTERLLDAKPPHLRDHRAMYAHVERVEESNSKRYHIRYSTAEDGFAKQENIRECTFDGKTTTEYHGGEKLGTIDPGLIGRNTETKNHLKRYMLLNPHPISTKNLEEFPNHAPTFVLILRSALSNSTASIRPNLEQVAGELCHVVDMIFKNERVDTEHHVWFAHDKGFLPLRYQHYNKGRLIEEIEVEQIALAETDTGGIWYPIKAHRTQEAKTFGGGTLKYGLTTHAFVPNVKVDKDTFRINFPNGTRVLDRVKGIAGVDLPKESASLVGKPLPELKDLKIDLSVADVSDKMILVCFWDMQQRPSRHCVRQLSTRAQELKAKDIVVVAIQAAKVGENTLNQWVKKYNIPFPVGMVQGDEEKTRFAWGVQALPWLILTDRNNIVTAEGFTLTELDEKLSSNSKN